MTDKRVPLCTDIFFVTKIRVGMEEGEGSKGTRYEVKQEITLRRISVCKFY